MKTIRSSAEPSEREPAVTLHAASEAHRTRTRGAAEHKIHPGREQTKPIIARWGRARSSHTYCYTKTSCAGQAQGGRGCGHTRDRPLGHPPPPPAAEGRSAAASNPSQRRVGLDPSDHRPPDLISARLVARLGNEAIALTGCAAPSLQPRRAAKATQRVRQAAACVEGDAWSGEHEASHGAGRDRRITYPTSGSSYRKRCASQPC